MVYENLKIAKIENFKLDVAHANCMAFMQQYCISIPTNIGDIVMNM